MSKRKAVDLFAKQIGKFAKQWGDDLLPGAPGMGRNRALAEAAIWFGPDVLLWPTISASMAPPGTSAMDRARIFAEDAAINTGASLIGQSGGIGISRLLGKGKGTGTFTALKTVGDMVGAPLNMGGRRPTETKLYGELADKQEAALIQQVRAEEQAKNELLLQTILAGGALGTGSLGRSVKPISNIYDLALKSPLTTVM